MSGSEKARDNLSGKRLPTLMKRGGFVGDGEIGGRKKRRC